GPGLLATALSTAGALRFLPPLGAPWTESAPNVIALMLFTAVNVLISVLSEALHRARRRAEVTRDSLHESEARPRAILTSPTDAIITIDHAQRITLFNAGAEAIFGYRAAEMIGDRLDRLVPGWFRAFPRDHVAAFGATGVDMRATGGERVFTGLRRSGEEFPIEAR